MKTKRPRPVSARPQRVLLVDDHPLTRDGMAQLIDREGDIQVAWQVGSAREAMDIAAKHRPDLAIVDITLPDRSGIELVKDLRALQKTTPVLVVSMHEEALFAERALKAGARGYVSKQEGGTRLMQAIREVLGGQIAVSEKTRSSIVESFTGRGGSAPLGHLSDREMEVFELIGRGLATKEIADRLKISLKTVEVHRLHIKTKLKIATAPELIAFAARWAGSQATSAT